MFEKFPIYKDDGVITEILSEKQYNSLILLKEDISSGKLHLVTNHCICNNKHPEHDIVISEKDRYGLAFPQILCSHCGVIRSKYVFDETSNNLFYELYYRNVYSSGMSIDDFFYNWQVYQGNRFVRLLKELNVFEDILRIVEIGCGAGGILIPFKDEGKKVCGYDFDMDYIKYGKSKGLEIKYGDWFIQTADNSCDMIILSHVLEHFLDPLEQLKKIISKIKIGKYLIVEVPGLFNIHDAYGYPIRYFQNAHVYNFYEQSLRILFEKLGLEVVYGNEFCTFICQKTSNSIPEISFVYDDCLAEYPQIIANYLIETQKKYDRKNKKTKEEVLFDLACMLGWKKIRTCIKHKQYNN